MTGWLMLNSLVRGVENTCSEDDMVVIEWFCGKRGSFPQVSDLVPERSIECPSPHSASVGKSLAGPVRAVCDGVVTPWIAHFPREHRHD